MKVYTRGEIEGIMLKGYLAGIEVGRMPRDRQADVKPPTLEDLSIFHPLESSDDPVNMARKRPWLDKTPIGKPS